MSWSRMTTTCCPGSSRRKPPGADARMLSRPDMISRFMAHAKDLIHTYESVGT